MIQKIKQWFASRKPKRTDDLLTREQVTRIAEEWGEIRYNDGKRDGLALAREQATKSLKEILQWQNQSK